MKLLVTGGCGFIGSNFVRFALDRDPEIQVLNVDCLTYAGSLDNLDGIDARRHQHAKVDIADKSQITDLVLSYSPDYIINFAAESHVDRSIEDSESFARTNFLGVNNLLNASLKLPKSFAKFVQVSTDEVYGSLGVEGRFTEESPVKPNNPYSASKAAADLLVWTFVNTHGLPCVVTRCSNNYGPYQHPEKLIPLFISNLMEDKCVPIKGKGLNVRDWIYVEDHCRGVFCAMMNGKSGAVYNFGGDSELTNLEVTRKLLAILGKPESLISYCADRPGHDYRYAIDYSLARRELGWAPTVSFEDGLVRTVAWYRANPNWLLSRR